MEGESGMRGHRTEEIGEGSGMENRLRDLFWAALEEAGTERKIR